MAELTEEKILDALAEVIDPELNINIVDLGLIYNIEILDNDEVHVVMTMTTPGCPVTGMLTESSEAAVLNLDGVKDAIIEVVWDPPWNVNMMSDFAKDELGMP
ncbi:metal-sulfur cluster assembly factor [bacterium]|nr:metal-sulfur cluster assembly factor [bacterium]